MTDRRYGGNRDVDHSRRDAEKLRLHQAVVRRLRRDPQTVCRIARENLHRWIARNGSQPYYVEWLEILDSQQPEEIAALLLEDSDRGQHLRQTAPFAGVLTPEERSAALRGP